MPDFSFRFPTFTDKQWKTFSRIVKRPEILPLGSTRISGIDVGDAYFQMLFCHRHYPAPQGSVFTFRLVPVFPKRERPDVLQPFAREDLAECVNTYLPCDQLPNEKALEVSLLELARVSTYEDLCKLLEGQILAYLQEPQENELYQSLVASAKTNTGFWAKRDAILNGTFQKEHIQAENVAEDSTVKFLLTGRKKDGHAILFSLPSEKKAALIDFFSKQEWTLELFADKEDQFSTSSPNGCLTYKAGTVQGTMQDNILLPFLLMLTEALPDTELVITQKQATTTLSDADFSTMCNQHAKTLDGYLQAVVKKGEHVHPADAALPFLRITDQYFSTKQEGKRLHAFLAQEVYTMVRSGYLQEESGQFSVGKPVPQES